MNNIAITVANTIGNLFYAAADTSNLCGNLESQLYSSAIDQCVPIIDGQFVQLQNNVLAGYSFHLGEVQVSGFWKHCLRNKGKEQQGGIDETELLK
mgnify:CR=1 FL=1